MMRIPVAFAAPVIVAAAVPTDTKECPRVQQNSDFDDLDGVPLVPINAIQTPYEGLLYHGLQFTKVLRPIVSVPILDTVLSAIKFPGVEPHSGDNYARIGVTTEIQGTPMLTTKYPSSNIVSFRLESFYYGCTLQGTGAFAIPTQCIINVTGYNGSDNTLTSSTQVCSQTYQYNPSIPFALQQQAFGKFDDCKDKDLQFATITFVLPGGLSVLNPALVMLVDDLKYSTKAKSC